MFKGAIMHHLSGLGAAGVVLLGMLAPAQARQIAVRDGFEAANAGWTVSGDVSRQGPVDAKAPVQPHEGKGFALLTNPMPFPGTSLTSFYTLNAPKGAPCTFELWGRIPAASGALVAGLRVGGPAGAVIGEKRLAGPTRAGKGTRFYAPLRLHFAHPGTAIFVSIHAVGPVQAALDDVALVCKAKR